jgi:hypothetical protein
MSKLKLSLLWSQQGLMLFQEETTARIAKQIQKQLFMNREY